MMRAFAAISFFAFFPGPAFSQTAGGLPAFEAADVRPSAIKPQNQNVRGPFIGSGRYELRAATILDMIVRAYGIDADKIAGGPNWIEYDRFDITARTPANTSQENAKLMLQALLADRFKLVVHRENQLLPGFDLVAGKGKPKLKESDGSGETACKSQIQGLPAGNGDGTPINISSLTVAVACRNMTMEAFATQMRNFGGATVGTKPVADKTDLKGAWDFDFKMSLDIRLPGVGASGEGITFTDALEKQLGLKLEPVNVSQSVITVNSISRQPTPNPPDIAKILPAPLTEFEVAVIKPAAPAADARPRITLQIQPGGRVNISGLPLKTLVLQAFGITNDMLVGAPKWMDDARFDIIAKAPTEIATGPLPPNAPATAQGPRDMDTVWVMVRALLEQRFKLVSHMEERPATAYDLVAVKPRLKKADPSSRTKFIEGPAADAKDPRSSNPALSRLVTFQNMTMAEFAEKLQYVGSGYIRSAVQDKTGLEGGYDFALNFSPPGLVNNGGRGGPALFIGNGNGAPVAVDLGRGGDASEPNGAVSLFEAMEKQLGLKLEETKRPAPVLVIDHIEEKPIEN